MGNKVIGKYKEINHFKTKVITETKGDFKITTDNSKMDLLVIHDFLTNQSYWSKNIPFEKVKIAFNNSLNFGLLYKDRQVGYSRVITDFSQIAYLGDVFVLEEFRGQGHSKWLIDKVMTSQITRT